MPRGMDLQESNHTGDHSCKDLPQEWPVKGVPFSVPIGSVQGSCFKEDANGGV